MQNPYKDIKRFKEEKLRILYRRDNSRQGCVDAEIIQLVDLINSKEDYCTTSSCAGRITILERSSYRKIDSRWLLSSHQPVTFKSLKARLASSHDVWLMQESFILHVFCRDMQAAEKLLGICKEMGLKRTGIVSLSRRIMLETMGNEKVEALLIKQGRLLVDDAYLHAAIGECNLRMAKNREKMEKLCLALGKL